MNQEQLVRRIKVLIGRDDWSEIVITKEGHGYKLEINDPNRGVPFSKKLLEDKDPLKPDKSLRGTMKGW